MTAHLDAHYTDQRLVALYDAQNPMGDDTDYCLSIAREISAARIVDVGCGTGALATALAAQGAHVVGIDPSPAMLDVARTRPGGDQVTWIRADGVTMGRADAVGQSPDTLGGFDLAVMTGHVAQVFLDDATWLAVLQNLRAMLRPGGYLVFDSRNPEAAPWCNWTPAATRRTVSSAGEVFDTWLDVTTVADGRVTFTAHTRFAADGQHLTSESTLAFRSCHDLESSLHEAGFMIAAAYGDWRRGPVSSASPEFVIVAQLVDGA